MNPRPLFLVYWRSEPPCSWCHKAISLLESRNIEFLHIDISEPGANRDKAFELLKTYKWATVPAIFSLGLDCEITGLIGGYDKLVIELDNRL